MNPIERLKKNTYIFEMNYEVDRKPLLDHYLNFISETKNCFVNRFYNEPSNTASV